MDDNRIEKWNREFTELGPEKVRGDLMLGRWDKEKRVAARQWLERHDTRNWQAASPPGTPRGSFIQSVINKRNAKWWGYAIGAFVLGLGVLRVWRRL